jgi:hypothetical protein
MSKIPIDLIINDYTEKSFVVRGDTITHKKELKMMGGKWNSRLKDGCGWIFPKTKKVDVENYIKGVESKPFFQDEKYETNNTIGIHKKLDTLLNRVSKLEKLLEKITSLNGNTELEDVEDFDNDIIVNTHKRLL